MTSDQKSAAHEPARPYLAIESPGGAWHPHQLEVQDFGSYGLIADIRSKADYLDDHIPEAVQVEPEDVNEASQAQGSSGVVPQGLQRRLDLLANDDPVLVYDGQGGRVSEPLAAMLRRSGRQVDVLPGGWINYRRWVQAGLQLLPRLFEWRVIGTALGSEARHVLQAIGREGHQALDVAMLGGWSAGQLLAASSIEQPSQAWFESRLVHALRHLDGRCAVWTGDMGQNVGSLKMPQALVDALGLAPVVPLEASIAVRCRQWLLDEPVFAGDPSDVLAIVSTSAAPPERELVGRWQTWLRDGASERFVASLLQDHVDANYRARSDSQNRRHTLPPIVVESFDAEALARSVRASLPKTA